MNELEHVAGMLQAYKEDYHCTACICVICCVGCREWYVPTGRCLHIMKGHTAAVNAVAITANGFKAVTGSSDSTIKVWNTDPSSRYSCMFAKLIQYTS